jgi:hypothetical protein
MTATPPVINAPTIANNFFIRLSPNLLKMQLMLIVPHWMLQ